MGVKVANKASSRAPTDKTPRTARGERTLRKILDGARQEFGERGFSDSSIVGITQRAGVALGTFYTYFEFEGGAVPGSGARHVSRRSRRLRLRHSRGRRMRLTPPARDSNSSFSSRATIATSIGSLTKRSSLIQHPTASIMKQPRPALPRVLSRLARRVRSLLICRTKTSRSSPGHRWVQTFSSACVTPCGQVRTPRMWRLLQTECCERACPHE